MAAKPGDKKTAARRERLNVTAVKAIEKPAEGRVYVYDTEADHLAICVTSTDRRTWYWVGRSGGKTYREKIGRFPDIKPEKARDLARAKTGAKANGEELHAAKQARRADLKLFEAYQRFRSEPSRKTRRPKREKTLEFYDKLFAEPRSATATRKATAGGPLYDWRDRRLTTITRPQLQRLHEHLVEERGPYQANRSVALIKAIYNTARSRWDHPGDNPAQGVELAAERGRVRYLRQDEAQRFMDALNSEWTDPLIRDAIKVLLLTGARKGNVLSMRWKDIDLDARTWHIGHDEAKHGDDIFITLTPEAIAVLRHRRAVTDEAEPHVFPSKRAASGHLADVRATMKDVLDRADVHNFRVHDLRHTLASWMAANGVGLPIIGRQLGHKTAQTTAKYAHVDLDAVRGAVDNAIDGMLGGER